MKIFTFHYKHKYVKQNANRKQEKTSFENILFSSFCIIYILISVFFSIVFFPKEQETSINSYYPHKITICLDAGHGGIDGGATGSFTKESDINLAITKKLTKLFNAGNYNVVNTRTSDICLCDDIYSPSFKLDDMKKRRQIIQNCNPDILISIHCNKFHLTSCVGAQVFFQKNSTNGESLANIMTSHFVSSLPNARLFPLSADYYVLDSVNCPAVLVECGYVSNPEEEKLLASDEYQEKIAYSIYAGTLKYLMTSV